MGWLFWRRSSKDFPEPEQKRCRTIRSAYTACCRAAQQSCSGLETSLLLCYAERLAPKQADALKQCMVAAGGSAYVTGSECKREVQALKDSLKAYRY